MESGSARSLFWSLGGSNCVLGFGFPKVDTKRLKNTSKSMKYVAIGEVSAIFKRWEWETISEKEEEEEEEEEREELSW